MTTSELFAQRLLGSIDRFTDWSGRSLAWLTLAMMVLLCVVVIMRYVFEMGAVAMQESVTYLHSAVFLLGAAYTLKHDEHVRVDIFYRRLSPQRQAWINSIGTIVFLLPLCAYIFITSLDFVTQSWQIREVSTEPGGIPAVFILKSLIPVMAINLGLQGLAELLRNVLLLITVATHD